MKKYLFDTSVFIAGALKEHPHHQLALKWLDHVWFHKLEGYLSTHGMAEIYGVLTRLPRKPVILPAFCEDYILNKILSKFHAIDLSTKDYRDCIKNAVKNYFTGGLIYDALHVRAALKKKLDGIVTLDLKHYEQLTKDTDLKIIDPRQ